MNLIKEHLKANIIVYFTIFIISITGIYFVNNNNEASLIDFLFIASSLSFIGNSFIMMFIGVNFDVISRDEYIDIDMSEFKYIVFFEVFKVLIIISFALIMDKTFNLNEINQGIKAMIFFAVLAQLLNIYHYYQFFKFKKKDKYNTNYRSNYFYG